MARVSALFKRVRECDDRCKGEARRYTSCKSYDRGFCSCEGCSSNASLRRNPLLAGIGSDRGTRALTIRKLVEHFGTADRILQASLTELEATGMRVVSAQSLATGKSLELAQDEVAQAARANATIISLSGASIRRS